MGKIFIQISEVEVSKTVNYSNPSNLSTCNFFEIRYKISQRWKLDNICTESRVKHVDYVCQHHQLKNEFQMNWIKVNWKWNRWINRWAAFDIHRRNEVFDDGEYLKAKENASLCEREPHPKLLNSAHSLAGKFLFFLFSGSFFNLLETFNCLDSDVSPGPFDQERAFRACNFICEDDNFSWGN